MSRPWRTMAVAGAATVALGGGAGGGYWATYLYLTVQARRARETIGLRFARPPFADGVYLPDGSRTAARTADLHLVLLGDSTAAGVGAQSADEVLGARLARGMAQASGKSVRLGIKAISGATSKGLLAQVEAMHVARQSPDVAVILVGANDVTTKNSVRRSAGRLGAAVALLRARGCRVVVGTCPDLGVIAAIPQPLRTVVHGWSLRLARAQAAAVVAAGGTAVAMDALAPDFRVAADQLLSADGFHPSGAGYALAATALLPALSDALDRPERPVTCA